MTVTSLNYSPVSLKAATAANLRLERARQRIIDAEAELAVARGEAPAAKRWYRARDVAPELAKLGHEWVGKCGTCDKIVPAFDLIPRLLPYGNGHKWVCKIKCD